MNSARSFSSPHPRATTSQSSSICQGLLRVPSIYIVYRHCDEFISRYLIAFITLDTCFGCSLQAHALITFIGHRVIDFFPFGLGFRSHGVEFHGLLKIRNSDDRGL